MQQFICGFLIGVYIGTYYNCKPFINNVEDLLIKASPKKKE